MYGERRVVRGEKNGAKLNQKKKNAAVTRIDRGQKDKTGRTTQKPKFREESDTADRKWHEKGTSIRGKGGKEAGQTGCDF